MILIAAPRFRHLSNDGFCSQPDSPSILGFSQNVWCREACTVKKLRRGAFRVELPWILRDSLCGDNPTPILSSRRRWLDEPTPASSDRLPPGGESDSPRTTRRQTPAFHRRSAPPAGSQSQGHRAVPPWANCHDRHSRHPAPLASGSGRQEVDLCQNKFPRPTAGKS